MPLYKAKLLEKMELSKSIFKVTNQLKAYYTSEEGACFNSYNSLLRSKNLLKLSTYTRSGARGYTDADFAKLQQILLLKYLGFSLTDIREMTL